MTTLSDPQLSPELHARQAAPTHTRYFVLSFLCVLAFILYLDRICISQAAPSIMADLGISNSRMGLIFSAFTLAYGLFEIPTGRWADRIGSRRVLTRIAIWWSIFTALTGACGSFASLLVVRFLFGAGEAGAYPNAARIFARWFPVQERGRVQGSLQFCALIGGAVAPVASAYMIAAIGWRWTFVAFGSLGIFWAWAFFAWFRDSPADHPGVNAEERSWIGTPQEETHGVEPIPWRAVFRSRSILLLGVIMACAACNSYVYFSWFPTYLEKGRGVSSEQAGWLATAVLSCAAVGVLFGGWLTDRITRKYPDPQRARSLMGVVAYLAGATLLGLGMLAESPYSTAICLATSCFVLQSTISNWWSCAIEISGRHIGALFGLMNGLGVFGAMASQLWFGFLADWLKGQGYQGRQQWDPGFYIVVGVLYFAAVCWHFVDTSRPIDAQDVQKESS